MTAAPTAEQLRARVAELEAEIEEVRDLNAELADHMTGLQEELESARRVLDAEDLLAQFQKEVKRYQELARVTQARNNGLMNENADLTKRLKSALRKIDRLGKATKATGGEAPGKAADGR